MKKHKAFYIKRKDGKIIIRLAFGLRKHYKTHENRGLFIVFGKGLDWTRYF